MPEKVYPIGKKIKFRARVSSSSDKIQINIPRFYHDDIKKHNFLGKVVLVELSEISEFNDEFSPSI
jgi:hypothetical protein